MQLMLYNYIFTVKILNLLKILSVVHWYPKRGHDPIYGRHFLYSPQKDNVTESAELTGKIPAYITPFCN